MALINVFVPVNKSNLPASYMKCTICLCYSSYYIEKKTCVFYWSGSNYRTKITQFREYLIIGHCTFKNWMFNFVSLLKYKHQMTGNKLGKPAQRSGAGLRIICYPSSDV